MIRPNTLIYLLSGLLLFETVILFATFHHSPSSSDAGEARCQARTTNPPCPPPSCSPCPTCDATSHSSREHVSQSPQTLPPTVAAMTAMDPPSPSSAYWDSDVNVLLVLAPPRAVSFESFLALKSIVFASADVRVHVWVVTPDDSRAALQRWWDRLEDWRIVGSTLHFLAPLPSNITRPERFRMTVAGSPVSWFGTEQQIYVHRLDIPSSVSKVLYVDMDTLFVSSIRRLWRFFDVFESTRPKALFAYTRERRGPAAHMPHHLNIGVGLLHLGRMRASEEYNSWLESFKKQDGNVQIAINKFYDGHPDAAFLLPCWAGLTPTNRVDLCVDRTQGYALDSPPIVLHAFGGLLRDKTIGNAISAFADVVPPRPVSGNMSLSAVSCTHLSTSLLLFAMAIHWFPEPVEMSANVQTCKLTNFSYGTKPRR